MIELVRKKPWILVVAGLAAFLAADVLFLLIASWNMPVLVPR